MIDQSQKALMRILAGLAAVDGFRFDGINGQGKYTGVFRAGDADVDPDRMPVGIYLECQRQSVVHDREVCDLNIYIRVATRLDPSGAMLDALAGKVEEALPAVADGMGVVPGGTSVELADGFRVKTVSYQIFIVGELK